jgi:hypothetical protein
MRENILNDGAIQETHQVNHRMMGVNCETMEHVMEISVALRTKNEILCLT